MLGQPLYSPDLEPLDFFSFFQAQGGHQEDLFSGRGSEQEGRDDGAAVISGQILPGVHRGMAEKGKGVKLEEVDNFEGEKL